MIITRIHYILFKKTDRTTIQLFRYITLGSISNIVDFASLYILTEFIGIHYTISVAISFILGTTTNYIISIKWIFKRGTYNIYSEFSLVLIISAIGLLLNELIIYLLVEYLFFHYMFSKVISVIIVMFWNFFARKRWIFRQ